MDISEVAKRSGIPAHTLRFYEEKGLIRSIGRRGLKRVFAPGILDHLALISLGRTAGLTLEEIAQMFTQEGELSVDRSVLEDKAEEIDRAIKRLSTVRDGLRHAAVCPAPSHMECPTFRRLMGIAAGRARRKHGKHKPAAQRSGRPER